MRIDSDYRHIYVIHSSRIGHLPAMADQHTYSTYFASCATMLYIRLIGIPTHIENSEIHGKMEAWLQ